MISSAVPTMPMRVGRFFLSSARGQYCQQHTPTSRLTLVAAAFHNGIGWNRMPDCHVPPNTRSYSAFYHDEIDSEVDDETMARHNILSRRLYRILLRTCKQGVESANSGNSFNNLTKTGNNDKDEGKTWILLQPPIDQRKYGFAKIIQARRGKHSGEKEISSIENLNKATRRMSLEDVGMAMEVLRFVHTSLGGNSDDDLEEYYLDGNPIPSNCDDDEDHVEEIYGSAAAGRSHSEGHYTQFIDEDEERGEGGSNNKVVENAEWDSDESDNDENILESDESVLVTVNDLQNAIRIAFRANLIPPSQAKEYAQPISTIIARRHRDAIDACSQLSEQLSMWGNKSSISTDWERGVRVVATSSLMLKPTSGTKRYRFSYRIRVENISDIIDCANKAKAEDNVSCHDRHLERRAVQLLGRAWIISELSSHDETASSLLQRLLEQGTTELNKLEQEVQGNNQVRIVQTVNEPRTGAVGHLPVLGPGEVFEYMSGAEISTPTGTMEGCFHMAKVVMQTTASAHVGDEVEALKWKVNDERKFEMPVGKFGLVTDEDENL